MDEKKLNERGLRERIIRRRSNRNPIPFFKKANSPPLTDLARPNMVDLGTNASLSRVLVAEPILSATVDDAALLALEYVAGPCVGDQAHPALVLGAGDLRNDDLVLAPIEAVLAVEDLVVELVLVFTIDG